MGCMVPLLSPQLITLHFINTQGLKPFAQEAPFLKEKIASIFAHLAIRTFPLQWPDMNTFLKQLYYQNVTYLI
jgi:hypothetical protein